MFTGDAGSGESEIRRWIIENDWLECIIALPEKMFFNTGIATYIWIVTNNKSDERKGFVQLIDGTSFWSSTQKNLGENNREISDRQVAELLSIYINFRKNEFCKIFPNNFFGYTKVVVEQPHIEEGNWISDRDGNTTPDKSKRDSERIPRTENIEKYYEREIKPYLPNAWIDRSKDKIGYEINFTKYFHKYSPLRDIDKIASDLRKLDDEITILTRDISCD